jgi:hypothetical protein
MPLGFIGSISGKRRTASLWQWTFSLPLCISYYISHGPSMPYSCATPR